MDFKSDFKAALRGRKDYHALMELVRRFGAEGLSVDAAYRALHEIGLECGFDKIESVEEGTMQDTLESVMEKCGTGSRCRDRDDVPRNAATSTQMWRLSHGHCH
jgi:hypothetical protein